MTRMIPVLRVRAMWSVAAIAATAAMFGPSLPPRIMKNTIDGTASLSAGGRIAEGVVLIACTPGERIQMELTFTQGGVTGWGRTQGDCEGEEESARYPVRVVARGPDGFQPGHAEACADGVNTDRGQVVDTKHWCRAVGVELIGSTR